MSTAQAHIWRVAVAYSGGRDSTALLHATARMALGLGDIEVLALHVHHGLSPNADDWLAFAEAQCAAWASQGLPVTLRWRRIELAPGSGDSVEALAREGRYKALAEMAREAGCDTVLLGHHRRDQAETFLLQALRGAGVAGLAAMPCEAVRAGITWLRPWLDRPREVLEAYVAHHGLRHVDDESNGERRHARNRLRLDVWPALTQAFGQSEVVLAQAASHQADVLACLEDWLKEKLPLVTREVRQQTEASSAGDAMDQGGAHSAFSCAALDVVAWQGWPAGQQRELLRAWFRQVSGQGLPASWLKRLQSELAVEGIARRWRVTMGDWRGHSSSHPACGELRLYRGLLTWCPPTPPSAISDKGTVNVRLRIDGVGRWPLPDSLGTLVVAAVNQGARGLPLSRLADCELRARQGQERFQMAPGRPARSLKKQFQMLGVPAWEREGPLLWADGELIFVPGLGLNAAALAEAPGPDQVTLHWEPPASPTADHDSIKVTE